MATLPTLENVTRYKTTNSGTSWGIVDSGSAGYIYTEDHATRLCYSFTYTPTGGTRANKITLTCKLMATTYSSSAVSREFTVKLYKGTYPTGTAITDASNVVSINGHNYTYCSFAITIPDHIILNEETDLCIQIYSSDGTNQGWTGNVDIDEVSMYKVTYHANGHGVAPDTVTWSGSSVVLPELTADGYVFLGWSESAVATTGITGTYTPTSDVTLYAVWKQIYTIIYDSNGVGNPPDVVTVLEGDTITLPVMTVDGYEFYGWATEPSSNVFMTGVYAPTGSITLYAIWELGPVLVIFDDGRYQLSLESIEGVNIGEKDLFEPSELGKRFEGWYNIYGVKAEVGNPWEDLVISGKIKLYSKWYYDKVMVDGRILADIADAIRSRRGERKTMTYMLEEMPMVIASVPNIRNLLDNSDFTNPVNQRGLTSYSGITYTIDRWKSNSGYSIVTINDDCVNLKSSDGTTVYLHQYIDPEVIKSGISYTVGCILKDGSVHCASGVASTAMEEAIIYISVDGTSVGSIRFKYDTGKGCYTVMFTTALTTGIDIANVFLYEGEYISDTVPKYRSKSYGAELVECMRYYQTVQTLVGSSMKAPDRQMISLTIPMRSTPVVSHTLEAGSAPHSLTIRDDNETIDVTAPDGGYSHLYINLSSDF